MRTVSDVCAGVTTTTHTSVIGSTSTKSKKEGTVFSLILQHSREVRMALQKWFETRYLMDPDALN